MSLALKTKILQMIDELPDGMLRRLHSLVDGLKKEADANAGSGRFSGLCGSVSKEDAEIMRRAVEEREKVDLNAW